MKLKKENLMNNNEIKTIDDLNVLIDKEWLTIFVSENKILSPIIMCFIGLIPNCVSSVLITELYLSKIITLGSCISGLLCGSGLGRGI